MHASEALRGDTARIDVPAQRKVEVETLGLEEGGHKSFEQLLIKHAVHSPAVHTLA